MLSGGDGGRWITAARAERDYGGEPTAYQPRSWPLAVQNAASPVTAASTAPAASSTRPLGAPVSPRRCRPTLAPRRTRPPMTYAEPVRDTPSRTVPTAATAAVA